MTFENPTQEYKHKVREVADRTYLALTRAGLTQVGANANKETEERITDILMDSIVELFGRSLNREDVWKISNDCLEVLNKRIKSESN